MSAMKVKRRRNNVNTEACSSLEEGLIFIFKATVLTGFTITSLLINSPSETRVAKTAFSHENSSDLENNW